MAIRRLISRRGAPLEIYSDNATNFQGASNELKREIQQINQELAATFTNANTKWLFNPPSAPHMGGCWERLVRSVKAGLTSLDFQKNADDETFWTLLAEVESMVNSRPLTYMPLESENDEALTPNHFLLLSSSGVCQPSRNLVGIREQLRCNWKLIQNLLSQFWARWIKEYLPVITKQTKWFTDTKPLKIGDLVILIDETVRNGWVRGRVVNICTGRDGKIRQAQVKTISGIMTRPVCKLAVLDVENNCR